MKNLLFFTPLLCFSKSDNFSPGIFMIPFKFSGQNSYEMMSSILLTFVEFQEGHPREPKLFASRNTLTKQILGLCLYELLIALVLHVE